MSTEQRAARFASLSRGSSARRRVVAGYFTLSGILTLSLALMALMAALFGRPATVRAQVFAHPIVPMLNLTLAVLLLLVGELLRRRSRAGGILALISFVPPLLAQILGHSASILSTGLALLGIVLVGSIWSELDARSGVRNARTDDS
jgi:hypothetical protein